MTLKLCFSSLCALFASSALSAQSAMVFHPSHTERTNLSRTIQSLEQNALLFLIGAVAFLGICWLFYVLKSCVDLSKKQSAPRTLLLLAMGLCLFNIGCSSQQRAMAADYRMAQEAARRNCPPEHHYQQDANFPYPNQTIYPGYSKLQGPSICKYCGQRVKNGR